MIKTVYGGSGWVNVQSNLGSSPYINSSQPMTGMVRRNNDRLEVYDGGSWQEICNGSAMVDISARAQQILEWAEKKMHEEQELKQKIEKFPTLKHAYEQYQIVEALCHEEPQHDESR